MASTVCLEKKWPENAQSPKPNNHKIIQRSYFVVRKTHEIVRP